MVIHCKVIEKELTFNNIEELLKYDRYNKITCLDCPFNSLTKLPELPSSLRDLICSDNELTELLELPPTLKYLNGEKYIPKKLQKDKNGQNLFIKIDLFI